MAVVSVQEVWPGREGEDNIERKRTHTRNFQVITDSPADDENTVGGPGSGLPRLGQNHPNDPFTWLVRITPRQSDESPTIWTVTCEYGTTLPPALARESQTIDPNTGESKDGDTATDPSARAENPLDRPAVWKVTYEQTTEVCEFTQVPYPTPGKNDPDDQTFAILNSAGDPFDPPVMREVSRPVITVTFNVAGINFAKLQSFQDSVNYTPWFGNPERTVRILTSDAESAQENGVSFWRVTMRFKLKAETWDLRVIDQGYREIKVIDGGKVVTQIQDDRTGAFPSNPVLLDNNGAKLSLPHAPYTRTFRVYPERDFSLLGIR